MREIKFIGKAVMPIHELNREEIKHYNGWVCGNLIDGAEPYIVGGVIESGDGYIVHEWFAKIISGTERQCTGLKDKNGREIYESDIVKWEPIIYTDCSRSEIDYLKELVIGKIYYVDGITIGIKEANGTGRILFPFHLLDNFKDFEVLGNIYENPELLEGDKS